MEQDLHVRKQRALRRSQVGWAAALVLLVASLGVSGRWFWPGLAIAAGAAAYGFWQGVLWRNALSQIHAA